jgi:hypothetical protein
MSRKELLFWLIVGIATAAYSIARAQQDDVDERPTVTLPESPPLIILGSSSACGPLGQRIAAGMRALGAGRPLYVCNDSTGLARPDVYDWFARIMVPVQRSGGRGFAYVHGGGVRPLGVGPRIVLLLGGNDAQNLTQSPSSAEGTFRSRSRAVRWRDEAAWRTEYARRWGHFVVTMGLNGADRVAVITPPTVARATLEPRLVRVREAMAAGVADLMTGRVVDGTGVTLPPGSYLQDDVHLGRAGADAWWDARGGDVAVALGW